MRRFSVGWGVIALMAGVALAPAAEAVTITATPVRAVAQFESASIDPSTGRVWTSQSLNDGATFGSYASVADFRADTGFTPLGLENGLAGTYFAVRDGVVYGRETLVSATLTAWSTADGSQIATSTPTGVCATNATCTFDWAGGSAPAVLQDETGLYLLGTDTPGGNWVLSSLGTDLSTTPLTTIDRTDDNDGFAILMSGTLFLGAAYFQPDILQSYSILDDTLSTVDIDLIDQGASLYRHATLFDPAADVLYSFNTNSGQIYEVTGAREAFGVAAVQPVPLPASMLLLLSGLGAIAAVGRRVTCTQHGNQTAAAKEI